MPKRLPFCNVPTDKPKIKKLTNVEMPSELPFYNELNIGKTVAAFKKCVMTLLCNIEIIKDEVWMAH